MSDALRTQGIKLEFTTDDPESSPNWLEIGEITSFDGPNSQTNEIEVTHFGSTHVEKIPGLHDSGEVSFDLNLVPSDAGQTALREAQDDAAMGHFKVTLTDAAKTTLQFEGLVSEFSISASTDDRITGTITIAISGKVEWGEA